MAFDDTYGNGWNGNGWNREPAPVQETESDMQTEETTTVEEVTPAPPVEEAAVQEEPVREPEHVEHAKRKTAKPKGMKGSDRPSVKTVEQILSAARVLDDPAARALAVTLTGRNEDAQIVLAIVSGAVQGVDLLVEARSEPNAWKRYPILVAAGTADMKRLRAAAKALVAANPDLEDAVRPNQGTVMELAGRVGEALDAADLSVLERFVA